MEDEDEAEEAEGQSGEGGLLSPVCLRTVVQVHQRLCLTHSQALWYHGNAQPHDPSKDYISALVSSYQIAAPVISRFYHLIGRQSRLFLKCCSVDSTFDILLVYIPFCSKQPHTPALNTTAAM